MKYVDARVRKLSLIFRSAFPLSPLACCRKQSLTRNILGVVLFPLPVILSGNLLATEVQHSCDARVFQPCLSFSARVNLNEHNTVFDSETFGYTRSRGSWTVQIRYQPETECAKVSLFVGVGPLDFDRVYKRILVEGGGTIDDGGVFMYKKGKLSSALQVKSAACFIPKEEAILSKKPDPALSAIDRELAKLREEGVVDGGTKNSLDEVLRRLARRENRGAGGETGLAVRGQRKENARRSNAIELGLQQLERQEVEVGRILKQRERGLEQEGVAQVEQQQKELRNFETFMQVLGTGISLYNVFDRGSHTARPSQSDAYSQPSGNEGSGGMENRSCVTAQGRRGYIDVRGQCQYDDTARGR